MKKLIAFLASAMMLTLASASCGQIETSDREQKAEVSQASSENESDTADSTEESSADTTDDTEPTAAEDDTVISSETAASESVTAETETFSENDLADATIGKDIQDISADALIGRWQADENILGKLVGDTGQSYNVNGDAYIDFTEDGKMLATVDVDSSELICIKDKAPKVTGSLDQDGMLKDKALYMADFDLPIYDYDGKSFKLKLFEYEIKFMRCEEADDIYGRYYLPEELFRSDENETIEGSMFFEKSGRSSLVCKTAADYIFDEKTGALKNSENDNDPAFIRFTDDDTIVYSEGDKEIGTLKRIR